MMVRPMSSIEVVGPLTRFEKAVDLIQEAGVLQIEEIPTADSRAADRLHRIHLSEKQQKEKTLLDELLRMLDEGVRRIPAAFVHRIRESGKLDEKYRHWEREPVSSLASSTRILNSKIRSFMRRERNLADDMRVLEAYEEIVSALAPVIEVRELPGDHSFVGLIFENRRREAIDALKRTIRMRTGGRYFFYQASLSKGRTVALVGFHRDDESEVRDFISRAGISEMILPRYLRGRSFREGLADLTEDLASLRMKRNSLNEQSRKFYEENGLELIAIQHRCRDLLSRYEAYAKFARTQYAFVIRGWIDRTMRDRFAALLGKNLSGSVVVRNIRTTDMGNPPVLLYNPAPVRPFELLLSLLPLPKYGSIDPTGFIATFFPPMFGLMLGDAGYGLLIAGISALLIAFGKRRPVVRSVGVVLGFCAFFTIGFGFVFGEFFGGTGRQIGLTPLWQERFSLEGGNMAGALLGYLAIAVGVGVLHVMFGLVLGLVNARRLGDKGQFFGNLARIAGIFVGRLVRVLPPIFTSLGIVMTIAFLALMIFQTLRRPLHGLMLPLELLGTIGNILSYARIMAIGMASVVLALVANMFGGMIGNVVLAVIIVILVHVLNLALGIFDPAIQSLRLHYVEFFTKFYITGGRRFSPFKKLGGDTV
jgi:V/A-type H+-transporting ATPase subunit I